MSETLRGSFLIGGCRLKDPNFFKSVVLIIEHGAEGAMGFIVNSPTRDTVARSLVGHYEIQEDNQLVYNGGPVEPAALFIVHDCAHLDPDEPALIPGVFMGSSCEVFEEIVSPKHAGCVENYRVFRGCASWGTGQLEAELEHGDWIVVPASAEFVFSTDPYSVWDKLYKIAQKSRRILSIPCENPEWN